MSYQLWVSPITGIRRKGTRMSDLRKLFETGITASSIQEPLKYCFYGEEASGVLAELERLDFDMGYAGHPIILLSSIKCAFSINKLIQ
ncbi:MAG: hypothetical protein IMF19_05485 [Proteobacteria bacterium]|nr:hypothetical protein [Pseudomonadota bacterium]